MLFDLENFKRKVQLNPVKYDTKNLLPLVAQARERGDMIINLGKCYLNLKDYWALYFSGVYTEDDELGPGYWNTILFLTKESHGQYLKHKEEEFVKNFNLLFTAGIL